MAFKFQGGISPLIATILLLLIVVVSAALLWTQIFSLWADAQQPINKISDEQVRCNKAAFRVMKDEEHCTFYAATGQTKIIIENFGETDLNTFKIISVWESGSDLNNVTVNLKGYQSGIAWAKANAAKEKPIIIEINSGDCPSIKFSVKPALDCAEE